MVFSNTVCKDYTSLKVINFIIFNILVIRHIGISSDFWDEWKERNEWWPFGKHPSHPHLQKKDK